MRVLSRPIADTHAASHPLPRRSVLVVDDDSDTLASLCARLELDGHHVTPAHDGLEGLCRLRTLAPEVSIVDMGLRRLTGLDLARHARAAGYSGKMVALTGPDVSPHAHGHRRVFDDWLPKPVQPQRLRATLRVA